MAGGEFEDSLFAGEVRVRRVQSLYGLLNPLSDESLRYA